MQDMLRDLAALIAMGDRVGAFARANGSVLIRQKYGHKVWIRKSKRTLGAHA